MSEQWQQGVAGLIAPMTLEEFRAAVQGRRAYHFPGARDRFDGLFCWSALERLLAMSHLWSEQTMNLMLDSNAVDASEYTQSGAGREGVALALADMGRVQALLAQGATLVLDRIETLVPELAPLVHALASTFGATVVCNLYCSWQARQGFASHYDVTDVFALHIAGQKRWRIYEGRARHPAPYGGHHFANHSKAHHERAKGDVAEEVELKPGDVLYLPRGQYHDALASSSASLHLSFGLTRATGVDFMQVLAASLPDDELMREEFPHFDDVDATQRHLAALAARVHELICDPELVAQARMWQRGRVFRHRPPSITLPERELSTVVRACYPPLRREACAIGVRVAVEGHEPIELTPDELTVFEWMRMRACFNANDLLAVHRLDASVAQALLDRLASVGLIEAL